MAETGVPKFTWGRVVGFIMAIIVILIAVFVVWSYIRPVFGEFIEIPTKGEKARFMRYMTCALAMCVAPNRKEGSNDGCTSDRVMALTVEYDEYDSPVKGCQDICEEIRNNVGKVESNYCGQDYAISFTFQDSVKYIGNYSISGAILRGEVPCKIGKSGHQTDISCLFNWESFFDCEVNRCLIDPIHPVGRLGREPGNCGDRMIDAGSIAVSNILSSKCVPDDVGLPDGLGWCQFEAGDQIYIWGKYDSVPIFGVCGPWFTGPVCYIPFTSGFHNFQSVVLC